MKKTFVILVCIIIAFASVAYAGDLEDNLSFSFDSGSSNLNINGLFSPVGNEPVTMTIVKATSSKDFSVSNTPNIMFLYVTDDNGVIKINEKIPSSFSGGRYDVILTGQNSRHEGYFIFMNPSDPDTIDLIDAINSATEPSEVKSIVNSDGNAAKLGIDIADIHIASYLDLALDDILDCKVHVENEMFTPDTFLNMFSKLVSIKMINDGLVDDAMLKYASYFGTTSDQYKIDNKETDLKFAQLLQNAEFSPVSLSETYDELLLVARIKNAKNWSYMQDIILDNSEALNLELSDYNSIKLSSRYKVFDKMYGEYDTYSSAEDVKKSFDNAVKSVIKKESSAANNSGSGGSSGGSGGSSGGGGSSSISVPSGIAPIVVPTETPVKISFSDTKGHFAEEYILDLAADDVINGYEDGNFLPDGGITRAEFSKVIVLRFGIEASGNSEYNDVSDSDWFAPYIHSLSAAGIVNGYDGIFNPNGLISRQDAAVICMRAATYLSKTFDGTRSFEDSGSVSEYALSAVETLGANGIINGDGGKFRPADNITRGEAATIICRLYDALN